MNEGFVLAGGTDVVLRWLEELREGPTGRFAWDTLDDDLRLCEAQGWLCAHGYGNTPDRDDVAAALARGEHALFAEMFAERAAALRSLYDWLEGRPGVIDKSDVVDVDMELVVLTCDNGEGHYDAGTPFRVSSFITHLVDGEWRIAARGRRLPVPGWPPMEGEEVAFIR